MLRTIFLNVSLLLAFSWGAQADEVPTCTAEQMKVCNGCGTSVPYCCASGPAKRGCSANPETWKSKACEVQCKIAKPDEPKKPVEQESKVETKDRPEVLPTVERPAGDGAFPADGATLSIQYKNSTNIPVIVWLDNQAFCEKKSSAADCKQGDNAAWDKNLGKFFIYSKKNGQWVAEPSKSARKQVLQPGQVWRITPPANEKGEPFWCFDQPDGKGWKRNCPGVGSWVTPDGITMNAIEKVTRFEYNINVNPKNMGVYFNQSAVDGNNLNATLEYTGSKCPNNKRVCEIDLQTCPYKTKSDGALTCPSPKFWPSIKDCGTNGFGQQWNLSPLQLVGCGYGDRDHKIQCHKWWATNKCAQSWLKYLQENSSGKRCDSYGWAYDEMRWDESQGENFDHNGNPATNKTVHALIRCDYQKGASLNVDITNILR